jgi:hypothetical protein
MMYNTHADAYDVCRLEKTKVQERLQTLPRIRRIRQHTLTDASYATYARGSTDTFKECYPRVGATFWLHPCIRQRMLAYADVCGPHWTFKDCHGCVGARRWLHPCRRQRILAYVSVLPRMADVCGRQCTLKALPPMNSRRRDVLATSWRPHTSAYAIVRAQRMLLYVHVGGTCSLHPDARIRQHMLLHVLSVCCYTCT